MKLARSTGIGLVMANMIGAGVFLSCGFMVQDLGPAEVLFSWLVGIFGTMLGIVAYGALAAHIGKSGGEYRYLSDTLHPALGYLSGWASLLVGFSAAIAVDAVAVGELTRKLWPDAPDPRMVGTILIMLLTGAHMVRHRASHGTQNLLIAAKLLLVGGFLVVGLSAGSWAWPAWEAPGAVDGRMTAKAFFGNQYWITFAFSGWNAAIYAAGEFENPKRDVPFAMAAGAGAVAVLYLLVNWIFVANLTPEVATAVFSHDETRVTMGHLVMESLVGPAGGWMTSAAMVVVFISAMSAMTLVGPRVYASMAEDGFLPSALGPREGQPPAGSVLLQSLVATGLVWSHSILESVQSVGGILMIFGGLTALSVLRLPGASRLVRACGAAYAAWMAVLLYVGVTASTKLLVTLVVVLGIGTMGYVAGRARREG